MSNPSHDFFSIVKNHLKPNQTLLEQTITESPSKQKLQSLMHWRNFIQSNSIQIKVLIPNA